MIRSRHLLQQPFNAFSLAMNLSNQNLPGSRWRVVWERINTDNHYIPVDEAPFYLTFTDHGFVTDDGFEGFWTWTLYPGGRLVVHINDDHPSGLGCYMGKEQQEIILCLGPNASNPTAERMRWTRAE